MKISLIPIGILTLAAMAAGPRALATDRYVALSGVDATTSGPIGAPYATINYAISKAIAGDTIYVRGGTYNLNSTVSIGSSKNGTAANPYKLYAYQGETPVLDFRDEPFDGNNNGIKGISLNGSYWRIKGFTVQYAADNGISIAGSNNIVEQVISRQNQDSGFQIAGSSSSSLASNNLILNCDSYGNFDYVASALGENADGFAVKFRNLGPGNVISGARSYNNGDDGFDFWEARNGIQVINSWSFHNGLAAVFNISSPLVYAGDGNGIKLGHDSGTHVLKNLLVWGNPAHGVDINGNATAIELPSDTIPHGVQILDVTAASNGGKNFNFDENPTTATPPTNHILRNNISMSGSVTIMTGNTSDHNSWNTGLTATAADFVSTVDPVTANSSFHPIGAGGDRDGTTTPVYATGAAVGPRQADGSLPLIDFMHLKSTSHLINAGVDVGLPFNGSAPDLGAFEYTPPVVYAPADFNTDGKVDETDLGLWSGNFGLASGAAKGQGDADADGDVDTADFLAWQAGLTASASGAAGAVPEPASIALATCAVASLEIGRCRRRAAARR